MQDLPLQPALITIWREIASNKRALVLSGKQTSGAYKPKLHRASELSVLFTQKTQRNHLNKQLESSTIIKLSVGFGLGNILCVGLGTQQRAFIIQLKSNEDVCGQYKCVTSGRLENAICTLSRTYEM